MLRIFLVMVSLSWAGVGVNHNFWNVSFTNFYREYKFVCFSVDLHFIQICQTQSLCDEYDAIQREWKSHLKTNKIVRRQKGQLIRTLIPSSSLTLRIILTHISVILLKVGCSRQMSLRILITRFLTLIPVSCRSKQKGFTMFSMQHIKVFIYKRNGCIGCNDTSLPIGGSMRL